MKKKFLTLIVTALLTAGSVNMISCSGNEPQETETEITVDQLPESIKEFVNKYFYGYSIEKIEKEVEDNITLYHLDLEEGYSLTFNDTGEWLQVTAPYGKTIPTGFIPEAVMQTLNQRFPGYGLNQVNTTGEGYKVELSDNQGGAALDVFFDMAGEITGIDELD